MSNVLDQLRPNTTVGIVTTAIVALVLLPVLIIEATEVLFALAIVVPLMWFLARSGEFGDLGDDDIFDSLGDDEAALDRLRRRYADGDLSDDEFERRLDRLLETETLEDAKRRKSRKGERNRERDRER